MKKLMVVLLLALGIFGCQRGFSDKEVKTLKQVAVNEMERIKTSLLMAKVGDVFTFGGYAYTITDSKHGVVYFLGDPKESLPAPLAGISVSEGRGSYYAKVSDLERVVQNVLPLSPQRAAVQKVYTCCRTICGPQPVKAPTPIRRIAGKKKIIYQSRRPTCPPDRVVSCPIGRTVEVQASKVVDD